MDLIRFEKVEDGFIKKYIVTHDNGDTTLEQKLTVTRDFFRNIEIDIAMDGFPKIGNESQALLKYGDWLERLGIAIRRRAKQSVKKGVN